MMIPAQPSSAPLLPRMPSAPLARPRERHFVYTRRAPRKPLCCAVRAVMTASSVHLSLPVVCATLPRDEVAEWLRRWTANPMGSARVSSNLILVEPSLLLYVVAGTDPRRNLFHTFGVASRDRLHSSVVRAPV